MEHGTRSAPTSAKWLGEQVRGDFYKHISQIFAVLVDPVALVDMGLVA